MAMTPETPNLNPTLDSKLVKSQLDKTQKQLVIAQAQTQRAEMDLSALRRRNELLEKVVELMCRGNEKHKDIWVKRAEEFLALARTSSRPVR